jgi:glycerate kinase
VHVVAAVDKYKGTASAAQVARSIGHACWELGFECDEVALADGGEGTLDVLGGPNRESSVTGPLGDQVSAAWRYQNDTAIIEMARASGLSLVGGPDGNDSIAATTTGVGELIDRALDLGAKRIIVGLGGSATTDGGLGAVRAIHAPARLRGVEFLIACDVTTPFLEAATVFAPQKGASRTQVKLLTSRLERVAQMYREAYNCDVTTLDGAGAAGGLAGGLVALGGRIVPGFDLIADEVNLYDRIQRADLVITGEGQLDATSYDGKVVGSVIDLCTSLKKPVAGIFGAIDLDNELDRDLIRPNPCIAISDVYGIDKAIREPLWCIEHVALEMLRAYSPT